MAQPGNFTPILLYGSSTPTNVPLAANLTNSATGSEIAINVADKNLFFKDSGGVVNTVPIRQSSTSSNGWLSSTDWNTFNNKAPAGAYLTAVTADSPLSGAGTSASHLVIAQANTSTSGYLSSTDWNTFNGKQAALVSGTNIKTVGGVSLLGSGDVGTIGVGYGGTGLTTLTAGYIPYGNGASAFSSSTNLKFDGVTLAVGGTQSAWSGVGYIVQTPGPSIWGSSGVAHYSRNAYFDGSNYKYITTDYAEDHYQLAGNFVWRVAASGSAGSNISFTNNMSLDPNGNLSITGQIYCAKGVGSTPTFAAYQSTTQTIANGTSTKVQYQTEEWDTNSNFDSTTNYRFTPTIGGYYQVNACVGFSADTNAGAVIAILYKNGSTYKSGPYTSGNAFVGTATVVNTLVYLNGSGDYIEVYAYQGSFANQDTTTGISATYFQAALVRGV